MRKDPGFLVRALLRLEIQLPLPNVHRQGHPKRRFELRERFHHHPPSPLLFEGLHRIQEERTLKPVFFRLKPVFIELANSGTILVQQGSDLKALFVFLAHKLIQSEANQAGTLYRLPLAASTTTLGQVGPWWPKNMSSRNIFCGPGKKRVLTKGI